MTNDNGNMIVCAKCGKLRAKCLGSDKYCQVCYRKLLEEYSFYDYKTPKEKLKGNSLKVCELFIEKGLTRAEIHKKLGLHEVYVQQIIKKHTKRVNSKGEERPF